MYNVVQVYRYSVTRYLLQVRLNVLYLGVTMGSATVFITYHLLEMPGQTEICDYWFKNHTF